LSREEVEQDLEVEAGQRHLLTSPLLLAILNKHALICCSMKKNQVK
jgi:hypothetical protein